MRSLRRWLLSKRPDLKNVRKPFRNPSEQFRLGLERLEGRMLLNTHPAGSTPHHIHPHLAIFVDGQNFVIPASIGHTFPGPQIGTFNEDAHTHTTDGILHFNEGSQTTFQDLKAFFDTWGATFNQNQLKLPTAYNSSGQPTQFLEKNVDSTHTIRFFVNGAASTDFEQYEPEDGDQIVISFETLPAANAPTLNPINNVTMVSNPAPGTQSRTVSIPLDATDPAGSPLTYSVTSSNSSVTASLAPTANRYLKLNVSARDIDGNNFTGDLLFQLYDDIAPSTVARIVQLVQTPKTGGTGNFYDGLTFHRIVNDFMAQGGDPSGNGTGGSGVKFNDEFMSQLTFDGFAQLAMANSGDDTNDSQFFITDSNLSLVSDTASPNENPPRSLNFQHTIFGQLVGGFDVFNRIMLTPVHVNPTTGERSAPDFTVTINTATIVTDNTHRVLRLTAPAGFTGTSTITVTATNTASQTAQRSFVTTVASDSVDDRPFLGTMANPSTRTNTAVTIPLPATDLENSELSFVIRDPVNFSIVPANVTVSINQTTRQATITPATGFAGTVDLLVGVRDGTRRVDTNSDGQITTADSLDVRGNFDTQVIRLTVSNSNLVPVANSQTVNFRQNTVANITLTGDDGDPDATQTLSFIIDSLPTNGVLRNSSQTVVNVGDVLTNPALTFTPTTGSTANGSFTFRVRDNGGTANGGVDTSTAATVSLVFQANASPTANPQTLSFQLGTARTITLTGVDGDADVTQALSFVIDTLPTDGTLRDSANNLVTVGTVLPSATVTYTPNTGFSGDDDFTFHVQDDGGTAGGGDNTSNPATITLEGPGTSTPAPTPRLRNRVVLIQGTSDDDVVVVDLNAAGTMIEVSVNGAAASQFAVADTDRVRVRTGAGDDEVLVSEDVEVTANIRGGQGDDLLTGGSGDDVIRGRRGVDEIDGGDGDDKIYGGRDDDDIFGGDGDDGIHGRRGNDIIDGEDGDDRIRGGIGDDEIDGGDGDDTAHGGLGEDEIDAEQSHDSNRIAAVVAERSLSDEDEDDQSVIAAMSAERLLPPPTASRHENLVDAVLADL